MSTPGALQVCRAACGAVGACAEAIGRRFEPLALTFLPELFRCIVGSIQVMTDSADSSVSKLMVAVPGPKLLGRVLEALCRDKNSKLRQQCAKYLVHVRQLRSS